jgi:hypothetical protein
LFLQDTLKTASQGGGFNARTGAEMGVGTQEIGAKAKMGFGVNGKAGGSS